MVRTNKPRSLSNKRIHSSSSVQKRTTSGKTPRKSVAAGRGSKISPPNDRKPRRFHPGTVALREIRRFQKTTEMLLRREPFIRLVRDLAANFKIDLRFQASALSILQLALEQELISTYEASQIEAVHAKRITIDNRDIDAARRVRTVLRGFPLGATPTKTMVPFAPRASKIRKIVVASDEEAEAEAEVPIDTVVDNAALIQAVAQELTNNNDEDDGMAYVPDSPSTDPIPGPATPTLSRGRKGKVSAVATAVEFNDNDMSMFG
jgi:histone H3